MRKFLNSKIKHNFANTRTIETDMLTEKSLRMFSSIMSDYEQQQDIQIQSLEKNCFKNM